jgi:hypothetical protein
MPALPQEISVAQLQRDFAEAILSGDHPIPRDIRQASGPAHASRFGVYRNNVVAGLIRAVAARYPVVRKLLWDEAFDRAALLYVMSQPPRSPVLLHYGDTFPRFLRDTGACAAANYLADIAELESARTRAYHAADATPLSRDSLAAISPEDWPELRLALHPSLSLLQSDFPVVSIWHANLHANDNALGVWRAECALVARPHLDVEVRPVSAAVHRFFAALVEGRTVGAAIEQASERPGFDLAECFDSLIGMELAVGIERPMPTTN